MSPRDLTHLSMAELIERSSLGTPGAKALRARTPQHVVDEIQRRIAAAAPATTPGCVGCDPQRGGYYAPGECKICRAVSGLAETPESNPT